MTDLAEGMSTRIYLMSRTVVIMYLLQVIKRPALGDQFPVL